MNFLQSEIFTRLGRNSFWLFAARAGAQVIGILFIILAARRLSPLEFGQFTVIAAAILIGNTFTTFGTDTLLIRELAKAGRITELVSRALALQIALSGLWVFVVLVAQSNRLFILYSLSLFPLALFSISSALLRAFERMDLLSVLTLASSIAQVIAVLFSSDLWTLCTFLLIGHSITALLAIWICSASLPNFNLLLLKDFRPIFSLALPFAALTTLSVISQRMGVFSVSFLLGDLAAGLFTVASRILEGLKLGHYALLGALLPIVSGRSQSVRKVSQTALMGLLILSIALAGITTWISHYMVMLFFGDTYAASVSLLNILIWSLVPYSFSAWLSVDIVARRGERALLIATCISLPITLILFVFMIGNWSLAGAAWSVLIGESIHAFLVLLMRRRFL